MIKRGQLPLEDYHDKEWWISVEVQDYLRISYSQLKSYISNGIITPYKIQGQKNSRNHFKSSEIKNLYQKNR